MSFLGSVNDGRLGKNQGLPNGLGRMNQWVYNIQDKRYYLFGGESGTGKTTLMDSMFIFAPYMYMKQNPGLVKINWKYYLLEQSVSTKKVSWAGKMIYHQHGLRLPSSYLTGKGKNRISEEHYKLCINIDGYIEEMTDGMDLLDAGVTPSQFKMDLMRYGREKGKWLTRPLLDGSGTQRKNKEGQILVEIIGWTANDPEEKHIFLMDHIAYAQIEKANLKLNIDTISRTIVWFREKTNWIFAIIQQFNTELASVERQKFKKGAMAPQRVDFGDSRYTFQDADVVFGLMNPYKLDMPEFMGVDVMRMRGYAVWVFLMKNRHEGPADKTVGYVMDPVGGCFNEMPDAKGNSAAIAALSASGDPLEPYYEMVNGFLIDSQQFEII